MIGCKLAVKYNQMIWRRLKDLIMVGKNLVLQQMQLLINHRTWARYTLALSVTSLQTANLKNRKHLDRLQVLETSKACLASKF